MINILRTAAASGDAHISVFSFKHPELKGPLPLMSFVPTQPKIALLDAGSHRRMGCWGLRL